MERYEGMEVEIIRFQAKDIVTGSGDQPPELPDDPL